jgi:hypothetical protein
MTLITLISLKPLIALGTLETLITLKPLGAYYTSDTLWSFLANRALLAL